MADFVADLRDIRFVLFEHLRLQELIGREPFAEFGRDDLEMILEEAYRFARDEMWPASIDGDQQGCTFEDGEVKVPEAYRQPYKLYSEAQWLSLNHSPQWGGQGAPQSMRVAVDDMFYGANSGLNLGMLLTPGAALMIANHGTEELKQTYLHKMYAGHWGGTMCLTEPQAGSDVGASTTKAIPDGDRYLIEGEKIFITYGDHDLVDNIVHCVLARIEGAPKGTKGLSLFAVPKHRVDPDGTIDEFNNVVCTNIEHKMGIHGSPTCTLSFGGSGPCWGWLIGEENGGMALMFEMMNDARVAVGLQGAALGNAAFQQALAYAKERLQGSSIEDFKDPEAPRVPIIKHPDVRMMLLRQKAYGEGCRALLIFTAYCMDASRAASSEAERAGYEGLVEILTPICKAYGSDMGFRMTEWAVQVFGGYGYLRDYPVEQLMRDCKIASIYEGTNGIQAMDLVGRKLGAKRGANLMRLVQRINGFVDQNKEHATLKGEVALLGQARDAWNQANAAFAMAAAKKDWLTPLVNATSYLSVAGDLLVGYFLLEQAVIASAKLEELCKEAGVDMADGQALRRLASDHDEARYYDGKVKTARFFCAYELPQVAAKVAGIASGDRSALEVVFEGESS